MSSTGEPFDCVPVMRIDPQAPATDPMPWSVPSLNNGSALIANAQAPVETAQSVTLRYQVAAIVTPTSVGDGVGIGDGRVGVVDPDERGDGEGDDCAVCVTFLESWVVGDGDGTAATSPGVAGDAAAGVGPGLGPTAVTNEDVVPAACTATPSAETTTATSRSSWSSSVADAPDAAMSCRATFRSRNCLPSSADGGIFVESPRKDYAG